LQPAALFLGLLGACFDSLAAHSGGVRLCVALPVTLNFALMTFLMRWFSARASGKIKPDVRK